MSEYLKIKRDEILEKRVDYLSRGSDSLREACEYLSEHAGEWNDSHREHWMTLLSKAEYCLAKCQVLDDLLHYYS